MNRLGRYCRATPASLLILLVGVAAASINLLVVTLHPPAPRIHDEFSYLLAADTFASGRLTNPTHPHWPHFETMHVIHQPSYASKYPPAQGLLLAAARLVTGKELVGVCVSTGMAAAATCWMLLAWMPRRWALLGGLLVAVHPAIQLQWGMSYWGGALAMFAGALVLGGAARLIKRDQSLLTAAIAFACGAVLLAITRPFEGFVLTLASSIVVLIGWLRSRPASWPTLLSQAVAPIVLIGVTGVAGLLSYNAAITGSPLRMPYQVHEADYGATPLFVWQEPKLDQTYRNDPMRRYHLSASMWWFDQQQTLAGLVELKAWLIKSSLKFYYRIPIALALLSLVWLRWRRLWPWLAIGLATWAAACLAVWMFPHYLSPTAPLAVLVIISGVRALRVLERRLPPPRRWITPALLTVQLFAFGVKAYDHVTDSRTSWADGRRHFAAGLEQTPGDDLVFVRYAPDHNVHDEWVYNRAEIDAAPIVWARELSPEQDRDLRDYFKGRQAWVLYADAKPIRLVPYEASEAVANND